MKSIFRTAILAPAVLALAASANTFAADASAGKATFDSRCKTCHLADGSGNKGMAKVLNADIRPLGSDEIQKLSDDDMKKAVTMGFGKMKPVAGVSGADLDNVIAYVRTFKK